jgi:hypothetical protein
MKRVALLILILGGTACGRTRIIYLPTFARAKLFLQSGYKNLIFLLAKIG